MRDTNTSTRRSQTGMLDKTNALQSCSFTQYIHQPGRYTQHILYTFRHVVRM